MDRVAMRPAGLGNSKLLTLRCAPHNWLSWMFELNQIHTAMHITSDANECGEA